MPSLSQYSEPELDPVLVALWCIVVAWLILVIICIECPPRFVRFWTIWCNKCSISLLGLMFCITFKSSLTRERFTPPKIKKSAQYIVTRCLVWARQAHRRALASLLKSVLLGEQKIYESASALPVGGLSTLPVLNYNLFDFFNSKFDHSSHLKIYAKYYFFYCDFFIIINKNSSKMTQIWLCLHKKV